MPEQVLVELLKLRLPVIQGKILVDGIGQLMEFLVKGRIAFPLGLLEKRVHDLLNKGRLKPQLHDRPP